MNDLKNRLTVVSLIIFSVTFAWFSIDWLGGLGVTASQISGAEDAWGFQWAAENVGWLLLLMFIGVGVFILAKGRRK